jgi:DNA-binding transcriptional LysR family regulator
MERFFAEREIHLKTGMEVGSNEAIKQSVQAGLGLGLLSRATIEQELELKRLVVLDSPNFPSCATGISCTGAASAFRPWPRCSRILCSRKRTAL